MSIIADTIRDRRTALGLTQAELAKKIGTTQGRIGDYERGDKEPSLATLRKIAEVLGEFTIGRHQARVEVDIRPSLAALLNEVADVRTQMSAELGNEFVQIAANIRIASTQFQEMLADRWRNDSDGLRFLHRCLVNLHEAAGRLDVLKHVFSSEQAIPSRWKAVVDKAISEATPLHKAELDRASRALR